MTDLFNTIKMIHSSLSDIYAKQATLVKDRFGDFFTYYKDQLESLKEVDGELYRIVAWSSGKDRNRLFEKGRTAVYPER